MPEPHQCGQSALAAPQRRLRSRRANLANKKVNLRPRLIIKSISYANMDINVLKKVLVVNTAALLICLLQVSRQKQTEYQADFPRKGRRCNVGGEDGNL
jgi:hypothetical protein